MKTQYKKENNINTTIAKGVHGMSIDTTTMKICDACEQTSVLFLSEHHKP